MPAGLLLAGEFLSEGNSERAGGVRGLGPPLTFQALVESRRREGGTQTNNPEGRTPRRTGRHGTPVPSPRFLSGPRPCMVRSAGQRQSLGKDPVASPRPRLPVGPTRWPPRS